MIQQMSLFDGQQRKDLGQQSVLRNTSEAWKATAMEILIRLVYDRGQITSDDLRDFLVEPDNCNAWGALFSSASKQKIIRKTGRYVQSKIPSCQGRIIAVWKKY